MLCDRMSCISSLYGVISHISSKHLMDVESSRLCLRVVLSGRVERMNQKKGGYSRKFCRYQQFNERCIALWWSSELRCCTGNTLLIGYNLWRQRFQSVFLRPSWFTAVLRRKYSAMLSTYELTHGVNSCILSCLTVHFIFLSNDKGCHELKLNRKSTEPLAYIHCSVGLALKTVHPSMWWKYFSL